MTKKQSAWVNFALMKWQNYAFIGFFVFSSIYAQDNIAPIVTAEGNQVYCPKTSIPIVTDFSIVDPDDTEIDAFSVQISTGYQRGRDILRLTNGHPNVTTTWNDKEGKLNLTGIGGNPVAYTDLIPAIRDVVFESTSDDPTEEKFFSLTAGSANYLPETEHYYEYVPFVGISWNDARIAAENRTFFGLQGYLVTILSQAEAQLSGEQAAGTGWIGGSDAQQEGVWRWMTGPEAGQVFWNGDFTGSSPTYAFWNTQEPNNLGDEDYAHITAPGVGIPGSWNDLRIAGEINGDFQPKGYIVEYGGTPGDPVLNLSASTKLTTPKIVEVSSDEICGPGTAMLSAVSTIGELFWFDVEEGGAPIGTGDFFETPWLLSDTTFYVLASANGCLSGKRTAVEAIVKRIPVINDGIVLTNCDEDGLADGFTDFNLTQYLSLIRSDFANFTFTFHLSENDAENSTNIQSAEAFNNNLTNEVFFRVQGTGDYCYIIGSLFLEVSTTSFPDDFLFELQTCDMGEADGFAEFNLEEAEAIMLNQFPGGQDLSVSFFYTNEDATLKQNEIQSTTVYQNQTPFSEMLFVRVDDEQTGTCFGVGQHLKLTVFPIPSFQLENEYNFCSGATVEIKPINPLDDYQYVWLDSNDEVIGTNAEISISREGNYSLLATSLNNCSSDAFPFTVIESNAPNLSPNVVQVDNDDQSITILNANGELGLGNYEFSLDSPFGPFQAEGLFANVEPGLHTIYAIDLNGCGTDQLEVGVIGFPKFFTPNNDTVNDEIKVLGVTDAFYQSGNLFIYDRYGKLLVQEDAINGSWNGFYDGRILPPSDYWYVLELVLRNGSTERKNGHFTLKQ